MYVSTKLAEINDLQAAKFQTFRKLVKVLINKITIFLIKIPIKRTRN